MDDKWFSFVEGDRLYMHRSWTAHAVFEAELRPRADDCVDVTNLSRNNDNASSTWTTAPLAISSIGS